MTDSVSRGGDLPRSYIARVIAAAGYLGYSHGDHRLQEQKSDEL